MVIHSPQAGGSVHPRHHHMMLHFRVHHCYPRHSGSICVLPAWEMSAEGPSWGFMVPFDTSLLMCMGKGVGGEDAQLDASFCNMAKDLTLWYLLIPVYFRLLINPTYFLSGFFFFFNLCWTSSQTQDLLQCSASTLPLSLAQPSSSGQLGPAAHCEHATTANESILHSHEKPLKYWVKTVLPCQTPAQCHLLFFQQVAEGSNSEKWTVIF